MTDPPKATFPTNDDLPPARHSVDFATVHWFGETYYFTRAQRACIKVLWEAFMNGTPDVDGTTILEHAESRCRQLSSVFRVKVDGRNVAHPAWGRMIVPGRIRGTFRLCSPEENR